MEITINGKQVTLNFGILFVKKLNDLYYQSEKGIKIGFGLFTVLPNLMAQNVETLAEVIYFAAWNSKNKPTQNEVYAYLEDENTDIEQLFTDVMEALKTSNATKSVAGKLEGAAEQAPKE